MELEGRPDFDRTLERFEAWYRCQVADRPPVTVLHLWRPGAHLDAPTPPADPRQRALDAEYRVAAFEAMLPCRLYVGDSFPAFSGDIASDQDAAPFGGRLEFNETSNWAVPCLENVRDVLDLTLNLDDPCWAAVRQATELSLERSQGRWLTGLPFVAATGDTLVALRGPERLCLDLCDDPEGVRLACEHLSSFFPRLFDDVYAPIAARGLPIPLEGAVCPGRANRIGCDFLALISVAMAEKALYPSIERQIESLDRSYFHLDSFGALKHLDWVLAQPKLAGVQWVYGANRGPAAKWIDVYQRIQAAGKSIELLPESVQDTLDVMAHLKPEGVWIKFFGGLSEDEARGLVRAAAKRSNWA